MAVEHADEELEPDGLAESESQHGDGVGDLLVAVRHVAQPVQQLQRQHARLAVKESFFNGSCAGFYNVLTAKSCVQISLSVTKVSRVCKPFS